MKNHLLFIWAMVHMVSIIHCGVIYNISTYEEIADSGDQYPVLLPEILTPSPFQGKTVLFALAHGVEDHEVYYVHQYFVSRGATVVFGCGNEDDQTFVVIHDFVKPTYKLKCVSLSSFGENLQQFDAVYIPGGVPSSSALRVHPTFAKAVRNFWLNAGHEKLLAIICSGTELLIDTQMLLELPTIVGSPASYQPLERAYQAFFMPASNYKGFDDAYHAIPYASSYWKNSGQTNRANLVIGKNPANAREFVVAIGNTWMNLGEQVPINSGLKLWWGDDGRYNYSQQFTVIKSLDDLPRVKIDCPSSVPDDIITQLQKRSIFGNSTRIAIAMSYGADAQQVIYFNEIFTKAGCDVTFICTSWNRPKIPLHSNPPVVPTHMAECETHFSDILNGVVEPFDGIVVPGGLFSTGGVLRGDRDLMQVLRNQYKNKKRLMFSGTGTQLMISAMILPGSTVAGVPEASRDLTDAGYSIADGNQVYDAFVASVKDVCMLPTETLSRLLI